MLKPQEWGFKAIGLLKLLFLFMMGKRSFKNMRVLSIRNRNIPHTITRLTGINDYMVADAPKFYEIAKEIIEITTDCIFVAHNVNFDYNVIHKEFADLGFPFRTEKTLYGASSQEN